MTFQLRDALRVGNIFLSDQFFSCLMEEREAIKCIRDELCRFAIITEPAKTLFGKVRVGAPTGVCTKLTTRMPFAGPQNIHGQDWWTSR